ncbi:MAG TPA: replication initiation factor domain-containing protein [Sphingomicrobium sp.]|nr:replication initiation factor domain-containing protein [Sphingomicrobium sp.]
MTQKTTVDWLRFRVQAEHPGQVLEALRPLFGDWGKHLGLGKHGRGLFGFQHSLPVVIANQMAIGRMDFGGESQRGWIRVDVPGKGCAMVTDWDAIEEIEKLPSSEPRRLDLALTTWRGEVGHDDVVKGHNEGRFSTGGRPPNLQTIINSDNSGRTCYVGKRDSDKFFRGYEKGYELVGQMGNIPGIVTHIDGFRVEDIYRNEVEFKAESRPIPWQAIDRRDQYFAGAYPFCADVLPGVEADILQRRPEKVIQRDLQAALANARAQYGKTLFTALAAYHGDIGAVWDRIVAKEHNEALVAAGVLLVDHD